MCKQQGSLMLLKTFGPQKITCLMKKFPQKLPKIIIMNYKCNMGNVGNLINLTLLNVHIYTRQDGKYDKDPNGNMYAQ